jgi:hypothetical protein
LGLLAVASFQILLVSKLVHGFYSNSFGANLLRSLKSASRFLAKVLASKRFHFAKSVFSGLRSFGQSQVSKIGYTFSAKVLASLSQAFLSGSFFLANCVFGKVSF